MTLLISSWFHNDNNVVVARFIQCSLYTHQWLSSLAAYHHHIHNYLPKKNYATGPEPVWWRYSSAQITRITRSILLSQLNGRMSFTQLASFQRLELCLTHKKSHISIWWRKCVSQELAPRKHGWMVTFVDSTAFPHRCLCCLTGWAWLVKKTIQSWQQRCRKAAWEDVFSYKGTVPVSPVVLFTVLLMGQLRFSTYFLSIPVNRRNEIKIPLSFDVFSAVGSGWSNTHSMSKCWEQSLPRLREHFRKG